MSLADGDSGELLREIGVVIPCGDLDCGARVSGLYGVVRVVGEERFVGLELFYEGVGLIHGECFVGGFFDTDEVVVPVEVIHRVELDGFFHEAFGASKVGVGCCLCDVWCAVLPVVGEGDARAQCVCFGVKCIGIRDARAGGTRLNEAILFYEA